MSSGWRASRWAACPSSIATRVGSSTRQPVARGSGGGTSGTCQGRSTSSRSCGCSSPAARQAASRRPSTPRSRRVPLARADPRPGRAAGGEGAGDQLDDVDRRPRRRVRAVAVHGGDARERLRWRRASSAAAPRGRARGLRPGRDRGAVRGRRPGADHRPPDHLRAHRRLPHHPAADVRDRGGDRARQRADPATRSTRSSSGGAASTSTRRGRRARSRRSPWPRRWERRRARCTPTCPWTTSSPGSRSSASIRFGSSSPTDGWPGIPTWPGTSGIGPRTEPGWRA